MEDFNFTKIPDPAIKKKFSYGKRLIVLFLAYFINSIIISNIKNCPRIIPILVFIFIIVIAVIINKFVGTKHKLFVNNKTNEIEDLKAKIRSLQYQLASSEYKVTELQKGSVVENDIYYQKCALFTDKIMDALTAYDSAHGTINAEDTLRFLRFKLGTMAQMKYEYDEKTLLKIKEVINNMKEFEASKMYSNYNTENKYYNNNDTSK
jgi:hypothetical protein